MTQWILNYNGKIIPTRTAKKLMDNQLTLSDEVEKGKRYAFDKEIVFILGDSIEFSPAALEQKSL